MSTATDQMRETQIHLASSIGPDVRDWLNSSHEPRILNVFEHACNLINEHREIMALVSREVGNGPFNLVIPSQASRSIFDQITSRSSISIRWPQLKIGRVTIVIRRVRPWNAKPDWAILATNRQFIVSNLLFHMDRLISVAHPDSLLWLLPRAAFRSVRPLESDDIQQVSRMLVGYQTSSMTKEWMHKLIEAVYLVDLDGCFMAAQNLAGLGIGLTPAGDDFLLGAMYATRIIHPHERARAITGTIISAAMPRTSSLSAAWIQAAARGLVGEPWFDFLNGLKFPGYRSIESSLHRLLCIGHTSGGDALAGFIGCLTQSITRVDAEKIYPQSKMNTSLRLQALQSLCGIEAAF